jgi:hypothetical protein
LSDSAFIVSRTIFDNGLWKNQLKFRLFFFLFGNALYSEEGKDYGKIHIKRGQFLRSFRSLQEDLEFIENHALKNYSLSQIKRAVDELVQEERIKVEHTELGTLFTIINYSLYQDLQYYKSKSIEQRKNTDGTLMEQRMNNTIKEIKEIKEKEYIEELRFDFAEKEKILDFVWLKPAEKEKLIQDFGSQVFNDFIERLDEWMTNHPDKRPDGKDPYFDHNKTIRKWIKKEPVKKEQKKLSAYYDPYSEAEL